MANFETVRKQDKLTARRAPYWHRLAVGIHIGIRKTPNGVHWQAKAYDAGTQKERVKSLGDFGDLPRNERYSAAVDAAREWSAHASDHDQHAPITVGEAWTRYADDRRKKKGDAAATEVEERFRRHVAGDAIEFVPLEKLTRGHVKAWRERMEGTPARQPKRGANCRTKTSQPAPAAKSNATLNRDMVPMRAALNLALAEGFTATNVWQQPLTPRSVSPSRRTLYLDRDQRRALVDAIPDPAARAFVYALAVLPLRPGALAALTVANFNNREGSLHVSTDKAGAGRRIALPPDAVKLLAEQARDKLPAAPLFARADGGRWDRWGWRAQINRAVEAAGLPAETCAYTLRHSSITDMVTAGLDLFTVGKLAGTSATMIEKHYGHLQDDHARKALAGLAL